MVSYTNIAGSPRVMTAVERRISIAKQCSCKMRPHHLAVAIPGLLVATVTPGLCRSIVGKRWTSQGRSEGRLCGCHGQDYVDWPAGAMGRHYRTQVGHLGLWVCAL